MWQEAQGHGGIWLERHVTGEPTQRIHLTTSPAGVEGDQEGWLKSEVLQRGLLKWLVRGKAKSREDQEEAPGGGLARRLGLRQICTLNKIPEERIIRKGTTTYLTDRGADCRLVHLDRGCWKTLVTRQKVCQVTWRKVMRWDQMISHHLTQPSQCTEYTPWLPGRWACSIKQNTEEEAPSEDSEFRTEASQE